MPLKLNIAVSRKIGQPNYGSRGATVGLEMEVDSNLVEHPRQLRDRIAQLFRLAGQSVDRELGARRAAPSERNDGAIGCQPKAATPAQIRAIYAIAKRLNLDLSDELDSRFSANRPDDLLLEEASQLIDAMQQSGKDLMTCQQEEAADQ